MRLVYLSFLSLFCLASLQAATLAEYTFEDPGQDEDFRAIIEEMRCLVCQNESLAGSNAELAVDLRNEIYEMMKNGQSKDDIIEFMVARYGDFVLYSPPVKPSTYPIWFGPMIVFLIGGVVLFRIIRRKNRSSETELTEEEQQRLDNLLTESTEKRDTNQ
ncbi:MAG: cytochrome c-type biogenesis protein [Candidatus Thiodiazotropha sp. 6PLUC2]